MIKLFNEDNKERKFNNIDSDTFSKEEIDKFKESIESNKQELYNAVNKELGINLEFKPVESDHDNELKFVSQDLSDNCGIIKYIMDTPERACQLDIEIIIASNLALRAYARVKLDLLGRSYNILNGKFRRGKWEFEKGDKRVSW